MDNDKYWRRTYGLPRFFHASNEDVDAVEPLPLKPEWDTETQKFEEMYDIAWQAYSITLLLSGGDCEEADRAWQASLKQQKERWR